MIATSLRARIIESRQTLKVLFGGRGFKAEVFGTGENCTVEIDEMEMETGMSMGFRKSYRVPGRIKWGIIVGRYIDDTKNRMF